MKFSLRNKLLLFSLVIALIPLFIAGKYMIKITNDELKSNVNDELITVVEQLSSDIDNRYVNMWRAPLLLLKNALENEQLSIQERISLLQATPQTVPDIVALQLSVNQAGIPPISITQGDFARQLQESGLDPASSLSLSNERLAELTDGMQVTVGDLTYLEQVDSWFVTVVLPLNIRLGGFETTLSARINLQDLRTIIENHPLTKSGQIILLQKNGQQIFQKDRPDLSSFEIVSTAKTVLDAKSHTPVSMPYKTPDGTEMVGTYSFPVHLNWIVVVQKSAADAYMVVTQMTRGLLLMLAVGFLIATIGSILISYMLTASLLRLTKAARILATGDLTVHVEQKAKRTKDEITELSSTFNSMVDDLNSFVDELEVTTKAKERAESELRLANDIQQSFIPHTFPADPDLEFWGRCDPAREVGGDFFDFFTIDEHRMGFVMGDVSGKGVPAALFMAMSRTLIRMIGTRILEPDKALYEFNERLCEYEGGSNLFVTMFYGVFDRRDGRFVYSTAGHEMPFVMRDSKFTQLPQLKKTLVAGILDNIPVESAEFKLDKGDMIFIYTDGLTEPINPAGKDYTEKELLVFVDKHSDKSVQELGEIALKELKDYQEDLPQFDDMTVLSIQRV